MLTRRKFAKTALTALPLARAAFGQSKVAPFASRFNGVQIGAQTYSYRSVKDPKEPWSPAAMDRLMDRVIAAMIEDQINLAEFWIAFIEPPGGPGRTAPDPAMRSALRKWRESMPMGLFQGYRKKFNDAGVEIHSAMFNFSDDLSDAEIDFGFEAAKALGTNIVSANCTRKSIKRAVPFAGKHKLYLSAHSEDAPFDPDIDGMVFGNNLEDALTYSPYMRVTLDTGHFTAYGGDVIAFVRKHHDRIANLHLKDRLKNHPEPHTDANTTEFGKGDAPIKEVLQLMKRERYQFPACIEYEYKSDRPAVEEVRRCVNYAKAALA